MGISRSEGYRRGVGKEEGGLAAAEHFLRSALDVEVERITDPSENYERGDLEVLPSRTSIEVKRQPIDPQRYPQNFIEVCEATRNPRHAGGLGLLSQVLGLDELALARTRWKRARSSETGLLRNEQYLSISIKTMLTAAVTIYVNPGPPVAHLYAYESVHLLNYVEESVRSRGLMRGAGMSNEDTFSVFVPVAPFRWTARAEVSSAWAFSGDGFESDARARLRTVLGASG